MLEAQATIIARFYCPYDTPEKCKDYNQTVIPIDPAQSIIAPNIKYMGTGKQTEDDCVLYAIANGSGVDPGIVKDEFKTTVNNLGMDKIEDRTNPENMLEPIPDKGGRGGVILYGGTHW